MFPRLFTLSVKKCKESSRLKSVIPKKFVVLPSCSSSSWSHVPMGPPDPIIGLTEAYLKDNFPDKVNVGVGAYRGDDGLPYVLPCVREAEQIMNDNLLDHEYSGMAGEKEFVDCALRFAYGEDFVPIKEQRVAAVQALSGTGGLRIFGEFIKKFSSVKAIALPDPTWGNHASIFTNSGLEILKYRYYDNTSSSIDMSGLLEDLSRLQEGTCVLLHACAHNPTGMDPTLDQWDDISLVCKEKKLFPFFDCAYQGFASGDANVDAFALRKFASSHESVGLVQSFSKNFGLYGQRVGALSVVCNEKEEADAVLSQMKRLIRPSYSNPPRHGARIVSTILSSPTLRDDFTKQCRSMSQRIISMRKRLRSILEDDLGSPQSWDHITKQIGMFAYSGMTSEQVISLRENHHIYCTLDGRISMAGVTNGNVEYIANAIHSVTTEK